ncbi:MAG TPA: hypothetical protein VJ044_20135 [Candidatus Hodarchaeales archaeon]|nr:hypothetical protein [Candidatus Hodarchaeales archaeon]
MKEFKIEVVVRVLQESKKHLSDLRSSVGPVTSESLDKVEAFLTDLEKEVVSAPKESLIRRHDLIFALGLLMALDRLLRELVPEAIKVVEHLLVK